jgi:hypothetical protein
VLTLKIEKLSRSIAAILLADLTKSKALAKVAKSRSNTLVVELTLSKTKYWSISIEENEINVGDTIRNDN